MKTFLYLVALALAVFTAVAYVVGKDWEKEAIVEQEKMSTSQRLAYLKKKAKSADTEAQYELGVYYDGLEDYLVARKWYRAAASKGAHAGAKYKLGQMFLNGRGVENNPPTAMKWFKESASQGDPRAQFILGVAIRDGWERKPDLIEAYKWFYLANRQAKIVQTEDPRYNPRKEMTELEEKMSRFNVAEAVKRAKKWLKNSK